MGIELARAYINVRADTSSVSADFENLKAMTMTAMRDIAIGAAGFLAPVYRMGQNILAIGTAQAASLEQTRTEMETLLGSAKETDETLERMTRFAVETPFEMPQLLSVSQQLITFGERGDKLFDTLKMLGDASSGDAQKFGLLGLVFNQIRGVGHLLTQDFRQLSTRGIISLQDIAKYYKVSTAEAQTMLSKGKISFEDFRKILESLTKEGGKFANGMEKQSKTLVGLRSTLNDSINVTKRLLAEPLMPYLKMSTSLWIRLADVLGRVAKEGGAAVSFAVVGATQFAKLGIAIAGVVVASNLLGISLKRAILGTVVGSAVVALGAALGYVVGKFKLLERIQNFFIPLQKSIKDSAAFLKWLSNMATSSFKQIYQRAIEIGSDIGEKLFGSLPISGKNLMQTIESIRDSWKDYAVAAVVSIQAVANKFLDFVQFITAHGGKVISILAKGTAAVVALKVASMGLAVASKLLGTSIRSAFAASGVGLAIVALGLAVEYVMNNMEKFQPIIDNVKTSLGGLWQKGGEYAAYFQGILSNIIKELPRLWEEMQPAIQEFQNAFNILAETAMSVIIPVWGSIKETAIAAFEAISAFAEPWFGSFSGYIEDFKKDWVSALAASVKRVSEFVMDVAEWIQVLSENWGKVWKNMPKIVFYAMSYSVDLFVNFATYFKNVMIGVFDFLLKLPEHLFNVFVATLSNLKGAITSIGKIIKAVLTGDFEAAETAASQFMGHLEAQKVDLKKFGKDTYAAGERLRKEMMNTGGLFQAGPETRKIGDQLDKDLLSGLRAAKKEKEEKRKTGSNTPELDKFKKNLEGMQKFFEPFGKAIKKQVDGAKSALEGGLKEVFKKRKKGEETPKVPEGPLAGGHGSSMKAGIFDIASFGKKFQEAALAENPANKTNSLLEVQNKLQEQIVENTGKTASNSGLKA